VYVLTVNIALPVKKAPEGKPLGGSL
jgi:hypothetical protein